MVQSRQCLESHAEEDGLREARSSKLKIQVRSRQPGSPMRAGLFLNAQRRGCGFCPKYLPEQAPSRSKNIILDNFVRIAVPIDFLFLSFFLSCGTTRAGHIASQGETPTERGVHMKLMLVSIMVLLLSTALLAQGEGGGEDDPCSDFISGTDTGCMNQNCNSTNGCTSYTFTAACSGIYNFDVWTTCTSGNCYSCRACAMVYKDGQLVGSNCHAANCMPDAGKQCTYHCTITLAADIEYQLWVCLEHCPFDGNNCDDCDASCTAHACLNVGRITPCWQ